MTSSEMEIDVDLIMENVKNRILDYILTNDISDDEFLIFEAIMARAISNVIGFARLKREIKMKDGMTSSQINEDINDIIVGLSEKIEAYFDVINLDDDEFLIFKQLVTEKVDRFIALSLLERMKK